MSWSNYLINKEVWKYTQLLTAYPIVNESSKSWHHVLHIQSNLAFSPTHISEVDWEILIQELAD